MRISFRQLVACTSLFFLVYFINILLIKNIHAETAVEEMRKKGQQCADWVESGELRSDRGHVCVALCRRYAETLTQHPELLTDESIRRCDEVYANTKSRLPGASKAKIITVKAPETTNEMVSEMNVAIQKWEAAIKNSSYAADKRKAQGCFDTCNRGITRINRAGIGLNRAKIYWANCKLCGEDPNSIPNELKTSRVLPNEKTKVMIIPMPDIEGVYMQYTRSGFRVRAEGREDWKTYCNEAARIKTDKDEFSRKIKPYDRVLLVGVTYDPSKANKVISHCIAERAIIIGSGKP